MLEWLRIRRYQIQQWIIINLRGKAEATSVEAQDDNMIGLESFGCVNRSEADIKMRECASQTGKSVRGIVLVPAEPAERTPLLLPPDEREAREAPLPACDRRHSGMSEPLSAPDASPTRREPSSF